MNDPADHRDIPSPAERRALNAALHTTGAETGFWDDDGRPAPWPDDIEEWEPETNQPAPRRQGEPPF